MKKALKGMLITALVVMAVSMVGCGSGEDSPDQIENTFREIHTRIKDAKDIINEINAEKDEIDRERDYLSDSDYYYKMALWSDDTMHELMDISAGGEQSKRVVDCMVDAFEENRNYWIDMAIEYGGKTTKKISPNDYISIGSRVYEEHEDRINKVQEQMHKTLEDVSEVYGVNIDDLEKDLSRLM